MGSIFSFATDEVITKCSFAQKRLNEAITESKLQKPSDQISYKVY